MTLAVKVALNPNTTDQPDVMKIKIRLLFAKSHGREINVVLVLHCGLSFTVKVLCTTLVEFVVSVDQDRLYKRYSLFRDLGPAWPSGKVFTS